MRDGAYKPEQKHMALGLPGVCEELQFHLIEKLKSWYQPLSYEKPH